MNYYEPREILDKDTGEGTGRWHFVCANRRSGTYPVGYCADHEGHESDYAAAECFHRYQLDNLREFSIQPTTQEQCEAEGCENWTQQGLEPRHGSPLMLCDEHRNRDTVASLTEAPGQIVSSF